MLMDNAFWRPSSTARIADEERIVERKTLELQFLRMRGLCDKVVDVSVL